MSTHIEIESKYQQENRCFTTNHKFYLRRNTHTGNYDQGLLYQSSSTSEIPFGFEKYFKSKESEYIPTN